MPPEDFIKQQKKLYKGLKPCFCPAVQETVSFNSKGLKHLMYDNKHRPRNQKQRIYRLGLVNHLVPAIKSAKTSKQKNFSNPAASLWILPWLETYDKNLKCKIQVKVLLKKEGNGKIYFLSVMRKRINNKIAKSKKKTKKPKP